MQDPYPRKLYLDKAEVMELLSMDRLTFDRFYKTTPGFPRSVVGPGIGPKRLRWNKDDVYAWLRLNWKTPPAPAS